MTPSAFTAAESNVVFHDISELPSTALISVLVCGLPWPSLRGCASCQYFSTYFLKLPLPSSACHAPPSRGPVRPGPRSDRLPAAREIAAVLRCSLVGLDHLRQDRVVHRQHTAVGKLETGAVHAQFVVHHDLEVGLCLIETDIENRPLAVFVGTLTVWIIREVDQAIAIVVNAIFTLR